jgi:predicted membrane channel-forming protein YqfA (hemolysin III family)
MSLTPPTQAIWFIAVILGVVGVLATLVTISGLSSIAVWLIALGWLLLVLGTAIEGM